MLFRRRAPWAIAGAIAACLPTLALAQNAIYTNDTVLTANQTLAGVLAGRAPVSKSINLTIAGGAQISAATLEASGVNNATGTAIVIQDPTTKLTVNTVRIGATESAPAGSGTVAVANGGTLEIGSTVNISTYNSGGYLPGDAYATLAIVGGVMSFADNKRSIFSGSNASNTWYPFNFSAGTLRLRNSSTISTTDYSTPVSAFLSQSVSISSGLTLECLGTLTLANTVTLNGGTLAVADIVGLSWLDWRSGALRLPSISVSPTGLFGSALTATATKRYEASGPGGFTVGPTSSLTINLGNGVSVTNTLDNDGLLTLSDASASVTAGMLNNDGTVIGLGRVIGPLTNTATGLVRVASAGSLRFPSPTSSSINNGTILADNGFVEFTGQLSNSGQISAQRGEFRSVAPLTNNTTGRITTRGGTLRFDGGANNSGTIGVSFGSADIFGNVTNSSSGIVAVSGNSDATFYGNLANAGRVSVSTGSRAVFFGNVSGAGTFVGGGSFFYEGAVRPGNSPGLMQMSGDVNLGATSTLEVELAGLARGTQYDAIDVTGALTLDGSASVRAIDGFVPLPGQGFIVANYGSRQGELAVSNDTGFAGLSFVSEYDATSLTLRASARAGDANLDASVNFADLVALAQHYNQPTGQTWLTGDFNGDAAVGFADLVALAQQYGTSAATFTADWALAQSLVPEPTMVAIPLTLGVLCRRRRR